MTHCPAEEYHSWPQTRQILACEPAAEALADTGDREFSVVPAVPCQRTPAS
jgi:hypothetical protein